jgi:hypothetical protein
MTGLLSGDGACLSGHLSGLSEHLSKILLVLNPNEPDFLPLFPRLSGDLSSRKVRFKRADFPGIS